MPGVFCYRASDNEKGRDGGVFRLRSIVPWEYNWGLIMKQYRYANDMRQCIQRLFDAVRSLLFERADYDKLLIGKGC